jgi:HSP20 family molecular chaperone IbpA
MNYDYSKRDCLLPNGCKDLIDVLNQEAPAVPSFEATVTDRGFQISAHLPGLRGGDLEITLEGSVLRVVGKWPAASNPFESVIAVPPGFDAAKARAAYLNGELRIFLPKLQSGHTA